MADNSLQPIAGLKDNAAWIESFERQKEDYLWCLEQPEILQRYANRVVILHNRQIIGSGRDDLEALQDVQRRSQEQQIPLPPRGEWVFVPIYESVPLDPSFFGPNARIKKPADRSGS